jgi:hypothetical protein
VRPIRYGQQNTIVAMLLPWQPQPTPLGEENQNVVAEPAARMWTGWHAEQPAQDCHVGAIETRFGLAAGHVALDILKVPFAFVPVTNVPVTHWQTEEDVGPVGPIAPWIPCGPVGPSMPWLP